MIRIALVGAGGHSLACHAPSLRRIAQERPHEVTLAAMCDLDIEKARRAAAEYGFARAVASVGELITMGSIDAIVAVLPIPAMLSGTRELLRAGVPLLIEKPLGPSLDDARALGAAIAKANATDRVMFSFNRRFDPALTLALDWAKRQGPLRFVRGTMVRSRRAEPSFVWGTGIHLIDALCHVAGSMRLLHARCPAHAGDQWRVAALEGAGGLTVTLEILPTAGNPFVETIHLVGDEYWVEVRVGAVPPWSVKAYRAGELALEASSPKDEPTCISGGTYAETVAFLSALIEHRPLPGPGLAAAMESSELAARIDAATVG